jgi:CRP-like cAMP-binding protein
MTASRHPLAEFLRTLERHSRLSKEDREGVMGLSFTLRALEPSSYLVREGEAPTRCSVLVSGFAYRHKLTAEGGRQIVSLHIAGEAIDFQNLFLDVSDHNVQMLTHGEVADLDRSQVQALARSCAGIGQAIIVAILVEASISREWVLNIGRRDSRARLAHLLCEFAVRLEAHGLGRENDYALPMTQDQLADALGLTSVHVNRTIKLLEAEGLMTRHRRNISFPDSQLMRRAGDFNERYLHLERQRSGQI